MTKQRLIFSVGLATLVADFASKWLVQSRFVLHESLQLMPGVALTYVMNPGAAFSLFANWPPEIRLPIFFVVTAGALWVTWRYSRELRENDRVSALALGLISGGAIGNLVDRVRFHEVVDFIEIGVRSVYTWPVFNVADSAVCVGVGFLFYRSFRPLSENNAPHTL